ncbi:RNA dependent RNA polymerase-domain-containing protein [Pisolithus croceorrhizus]|nr:RNA dependent RNA polymerase-domain-containing protein [Pisolithus croceorrhizus]KAI6096559.1 RNA dependent RNA polymerase-domain-containing protein [Pisolithus croceorrhizus]
MYTLLANPPYDQDIWHFIVPQARPTLPRRRRDDDRIFGKFIRFTPEAITLDILQFPSNCVIHSDDPDKFILVSSEKLQFPEGGLKIIKEYINRFMKAGLFINDTRIAFTTIATASWTCFMREASNDAEPDDRIYHMGDIGKIMGTANRAKRIGLLFSAAEIDIQLDPKWVADIPDIENSSTVFSDGCGLMTKRFAIQVSKAKKIVFRNQRYTPTCFRFDVLMMHPDMDKDKTCPVEFLKSMKKFTITLDHSFSVVGHSKPYSFGWFNNEVIVLLSSLGITDENLVTKQREYLRWIVEASTDTYKLAERVLLDGLEDEAISRGIRKGVCDPLKVLKEGQVFVRVTSRTGASTLINGDVLVVRNPCLHPGDCLKLRAVDNQRLSHLVDRIAFAPSVKHKHQAARALSSGGDLDGGPGRSSPDFSHIWSRRQSYDYPPNKKRPGGNVTRADLADHFASYNNLGLTKAMNLHQQWIRASPKGAMSAECQELNALHSRAVDGARVKIPDGLLTTPTPQGKYILDVLAQAAKEYRANFGQRGAIDLDTDTTSADDAEDVLAELFKNKPNAVSEYELFNMALAFPSFPTTVEELNPYLAHLDTGALAPCGRHAISTTLALTPMEHRRLWNSLMTSDILTPRDFQQCQVANRLLSMQRLYSPAINSPVTFFQHLKIALVQFTRKLFALKVGSRSFTFTAAS